MHSRVGHVHDVIFKGKIIRHEDGTVECINAHGKWINSFEAELHVKAGLEATEPVCHTLCGFASGALSYEFGASLMVIETKCVAKGDPSCEFEIRLEEDWLPEKSELIALYKNDNLLHELEMTYDALLHHKQLLEKLSVFQTQLTQNVTEKYSMEEIIDEAYRLLNIPIIVEDLFGNLLKQCGLDEDEKNYMYKHPPQLIEFKKNINVAHYQGNGYIKLASPVYINKKKYATCSLVYFPPKKMEETDYLFLEKIANAVALCLLYEEAQFGEQQRIRNSIVERLIYKQNPETIASSFKFLPFPFKPPFITGVLKITDRKDSGNAIDHHEQLMQLTKLFETWQLPAIVGQIGDELIILSAQMEDIKDFKTICKRILRRMAQSYPDLAYSLGLSQIYTEFHEFEQSLKEARIAERFPNKQMLTDYEDLGMLGDLVIGLNESQIREIAKNTKRFV